MSAIAFDTHAFVKRLTAAGMPQQQAEALADEQAKLLETQIATKDDLQRVKYEIIIAIGGMLVALAAFLVGVKFLGR